MTGINESRQQTEQIEEGPTSSQRSQTIPGPSQAIGPTHSRTVSPGRPNIPPRELEGPPPFDALLESVQQQRISIAQALTDGLNWYKQDAEDLAREQAYFAFTRELYDHERQRTAIQVRGVRVSGSLGDDINAEQTENPNVNRATQTGRCTRTSTNK